MNPITPCTLAVSPLTPPAAARSGNRRRGSVSSGRSRGWPRRSLPRASGASTWACARGSTGLHDPGP